MIKIVFIFCLFILVSCSTNDSTIITEIPKMIEIDYDYLGTWVDSKGNIVLEIKNSRDSIIFNYDNIGIPIDSIIKKSNNEYILSSKNNKNILLNVKFYSDIYSETIMYMDNIVVARLFLDKI